MGFVFDIRIVITPSLILFLKSKVGSILFSFISYNKGSHPVQTCEDDPKLKCDNSLILPLVCAVDDLKYKCMKSCGLCRKYVYLKIVAYVKNISCTLLRSLLV